MRYRFNTDYFAFWVRDYVGARKLRDVAHDVGISHSVLWRVMQGSTPSMETFAQLCGVMQAEPRWFFYDETEDEQP